MFTPHANRRLRCLPAFRFVLSLDWTQAHGAGPVNVTGTHQRLSSFSSSAGCRLSPSVHTVLVAVCGGIVGVPGVGNPLLAGGFPVRHEGVFSTRVGWNSAVLPFSFRCGHGRLGVFRTFIVLGFLSSSPAPTFGNAPAVVVFLVGVEVGMDYPSPYFCPRGHGGSYGQE